MYWRRPRPGRLVEDAGEVRSGYDVDDSGIRGATSR